MYLKAESAENPNCFNFLLTYIHIQRESMSIFLLMHNVLVLLCISLLKNWNMNSKLHLLHGPIPAVPVLNFLKPYIFLSYTWPLFLLISSIRVLYSPLNIFLMQYAISVEQCYTWIAKFSSVLKWVNTDSFLCLVFLYLTFDYVCFFFS